MACKLHKKETYPRGRDLHLSLGLPARGNAILDQPRGRSKALYHQSRREHRGFAFCFSSFNLEYKHKTYDKNWYKNVKDRHAAPIPVLTQSVLHLPPYVITLTSFLVFLLVSLYTDTSEYKDTVLFSSSFYKKRSISCLFQFSPGDLFTQNMEHFVLQEAGEYSILCITLINQSPAEGHEDCSQSISITNSAAISMCAGVLIGQIPRSDFWVKGYIHLHNFHGFRQTALREGRATLQAQPQCLRVPVSLQPWQQRLLDTLVHVRAGFHPPTRKGRENKSFSKEEFEQVPGVSAQHLPHKHLWFLKDVFFSPSFILRTP